MPLPDDPESVAARARIGQLFSDDHCHGCGRPPAACTCDESGPAPPLTPELRARLLATMRQAAKREPKPTAAQVAALRLASIRPLAYYRGGWYAPEPTDDGPQQDQRSAGHQFARDPGFVTASIGAIRACVGRGELSDTGGDIYARRWPITDAGRAALAAMETK